MTFLLGNDPTFKRVMGTLGIYICIYVYMYMYIYIYIYVCVWWCGLCLLVLYSRERLEVGVVEATYVCLWPVPCILSSSA